MTLSVATLLTLSACGGYGSIGVTPGGVQDMEHARQLISDGRIPSADDFAPEGLFSEHDLPLDGAACEATLCPRAAAAHIDPVDSGGRVLVQLGFASDITQVSRPALDAMVAIDVSGSMAGDNLETSQSALHALIDQLDANDRLGLVTFGNKAKRAEKLTVMNDEGRDSLHRAVDKLSAGGSTAMEDGLSKALDELNDPRGGSVSPRVFLLTDALPNVGETGVGSFVGIAGDAADDGIGLTVWGVGLDLGGELVEEISKLRGGNAYHFVDPAEMRVRVDEEFDFMVTPIAFDLEVYGSTDSRLWVTETWGAPTDPRGDVAFGAATLFPSDRDGGMGVTLALPKGVAVESLTESQSLLTLHASWTEAATGLAHSGEVTVQWGGGSDHADSWAQADDQGVFTMAALIDELQALQAGADLCAELRARTEADAVIAAAADRLHARSELDPALLPEAELMDALLINVRGTNLNCN